MEQQLRSDHWVRGDFVSQRVRQGLQEFRDYLESALHLQLRGYLFWLCEARTVADGKRLSELQGVGRAASREVWKA